MNDDRWFMPVDESARDDFFDNPVPYVSLLAGDYPRLYVMRGDDAGFYREGWLACEVHGAEPREYRLHHFLYELPRREAANDNSQAGGVFVRSADLNSGVFEALLERGKQLPIAISGLLEPRTVDAGQHIVRWFNPAVQLHWAGLPPEWEALGDWYGEVLYYFDRALESASG